jgi:membrane protease subunit (stomatin/prohibitin family)
MAIFDRIKYEPSSDTELVWKFPTDQITTGSQLIVQPTQKAIFRKDGNNVDFFDSGSYTLSTDNLPVLQAILNLPFGGKTPFAAEVWYVNLSPKRDLKWGTSSPIPLIDPKFGVPLNIRAFGQWGIQIEDSMIFLAEMVGARKMAKTDQIYEYFKGELRQDISETISKGFVSGLYSVFDINANLSKIAERVQESFRVKLERYGISLTNLTIDRIGIPPEELEKMQGIMLKKMEAEQLGSVNVTDSYKAIKTFNALEAAASNPGGGALPVIAQMGMANGLMSGVSSQISNTSPGVEERLFKLKKLYDSQLISQDEFDKKRSEILGDL